MKHVKVIAAIAALAMMTAACSSDKEQAAGGDNDTNTTTTAAASGDQGEAAAPQADDSSYTAGSTFVFPVKGQKISVNMPLSLFIDSLGDPEDYFESESCAFQGLDKTYTYKDFVIYTYPQGEKDYVASIALKSDAVTTAEGAYIGMSADEIKGLYNTPSDESDKALVYADGDAVLSFMLDGDQVSSITYTRAE